MIKWPVIWDISLGGLGAVPAGGQVTVPTDSWGATTSVLTTKPAVAT